MQLWGKQQFSKVAGAQECDARMMLSNHKLATKKHS